MYQTIERIELILEDYVRDSQGKAPIGIVLGPNEYHDLCAYVDAKDPAGRDARVGGILVTEYRGVPVFAQEMPGINVLIPFQDALYQARR